MTDSSLIIYRAVKWEDNGENNWKPDRGTIGLSGLETWGHREVQEVGKRVGHNSIKQSRPASGGGYGNSVPMTQNTKHTSHISPEAEDNLSLRPM